MASCDSVQYFACLSIEKMRLRIVIIVLVALIKHVHSARILGLFAHTGKSHQMVFEPLLKRLSERGHYVTVASFFPLKNPPVNYTNISFQGIAKVGVETFDLSLLEAPNPFYGIPVVGEILQQINTIGPFAEMALNICSKAVAWPPLVDALKKQYDVVIVESFTSDCMLGLLHVYGIKAPVIGLSSCTLLPWTADRIGIFINPSYLPVASGPWTASMSLIERIQNAFLHVYYNIWFYYTIQGKEKEIIEKHYGMKLPLYEVAMNTTLVMVNTFHSLNGVRPLVPGLIEVGGMHLDDANKSLPKDPIAAEPYQTQVK